MIHLTFKLIIKQGTPGFSPNACRIFNVFGCVIDSLDNDPNMAGIKRIVGEGV